MKKIVSLMLALLMCLSLCACTKEVGEELTLENYEDYLVIDDNHHLDGEQEYGNLSDIVSNFQIKGVSTNHIYKGVEVDFSLKAAYYVDDDGPNSNYLGYTDKTIDKTITVSCNVAGDGSAINTEHTGGFINTKMIYYLLCDVVAVRGKVVEN